MKKTIAIITLSLIFGVFGLMGFTFTANETFAEETCVIAESTVSKEGAFLSDEEWSQMESYALTGANEGTIRFAYNGQNFFFHTEVKDSTMIKNVDKIAFSFTIGEKSHGQQGNFDYWLVALGDTSYGTPVQTEFSYNEAFGGYFVTLGYGLNGDLQKGTAVEFSITFNDAVDGQTWGQGEVTSFTKTLYFGEKPASPVDPQPSDAEAALKPATENPTNVIKTVAEVNEAAWDQAEVYAMVKTGEQDIAGRVMMLVSGANIYLRMTIYDATKMFNDNPFVSITIAEKTASFNGKYYDEQLGDQGKIGWPHITNNAFGDATVLNVKYENNTYTLNVAYNIGDLAVEGAHVVASFGHGDQADETQAWADGLTSYASRLSLEEATYYIGKKTETDPVKPDPVEPDPDPIDGPENTDLHIVVTDIARVPTEADWEKATSYPLIPRYSNSTGATGSIKILTAASNVFFRLTVNDGTVHCVNDGIYIYMGVENEELSLKYEGRGNYDNWLAIKQNDFGSPSLHQEKCTAEKLKEWAEGTYIYEHGFYVKEAYGEGKQFRICVKHRDSRSYKEGWTDGDYFHTIYFDQVVTFGKKADLTVRPQEATEGFTAGSEQISYNKANITWNEFEGADTYKLFVFKKNAAGEEEPYTYISTEGPIYSGDETYSESILGLSATTEYAVQVVAYDSNEEVIGYSSLASFTTISKEEADNSSTSSEPSDSGEPSGSDTGSGSSSEDDESSGCGSEMGVCGLGLAIAAAVVAVVKKRKN